MCRFKSGHPHQTDMQPKFRGITILNNQVVFGSYCSRDDTRGKDIIVNSQGVFPVYQESVSQFTGLSNFQGYPIYEFDVLRLPNELTSLLIVQWSLTYGAWVCVNSIVQDKRVYLYEMVGCAQLVPDGYIDTQLSNHRKG